MEHQETDHAELGILLGQAAQLHAFDAADLEVAEIAVGHRLGIRGHIGHPLVDLVLVAVDGGGCHARNIRQPERAPLSIFHQLEAEQGVVVEQPAGSAGTVSRIHRVLEGQQVGMGDRARGRRGLAAGDLVQQPLDVVAGSVAGQQLFSLATTQTGADAAGNQASDIDARVLKQLVGDLDDIGGHLLGTNDHLTKLHVLLGAFLLLADHHPLVGGAVGDRPGDGVAAVGLEHGGDVGEAAERLHGLGHPVAELGRHGEAALGAGTNRLGAHLFKQLTLFGIERTEATTQHGVEHLDLARFGDTGVGVDQGAALGVAVQVVGVQAEQLLLPGDGRIQIPQLLVHVPPLLGQGFIPALLAVLVVQFAHLTGDGGALLLHFVQFHGHCSVRTIKNPPKRVMVYSAVMRRSGSILAPGARDPQRQGHGLRWPGTPAWIGRRRQNPGKPGRPPGRHHRGGQTW